MGEKIIICDHGLLPDCSNSGHLAAVLKGAGYRVTYVPRSYGGYEDVKKIAYSQPAVVLADPSLHANGKRTVDSLFLSRLEALCNVTHADLVLFALAPGDLGRDDILYKTNHPLVVEKVTAHLTGQLS